MVMQSNLLTDPEYVSWQPDLPTALASLMQNFTLALIAEGNTFGTTKVLWVDLITSATIFQYTPRALWIPYAVGLALAALCCADGLAALVSNRGSGQAGFKEFMKATMAISSQDLELRRSRTRIRYGPVGGGVGEGFQAVVDDDISLGDMGAETGLLAHKDD
ncbi:hypothetical protein RQP46_009814 [Phenoliferia psychrophenolica]